MPKLLSLPGELLESILLYCNIDGHPSLIAALAQVCRQLRLLVYDAPDRHLWRALFLISFDDPRLLGVGVEEGKYQPFVSVPWIDWLSSRRKLAARIHGTRLGCKLPSATCPTPPCIPKEALPPLHNVDDVPYR